MWYDDKKKVIEKQDRIIIKLRNDDDTFMKSIIIPTTLYPLHMNDLEIFNYRNTELITDENVLSLINTVEYHVGHCYSNTQKLVSLLSYNGYEIESYSGWLFLSNKELPIHHCWSVLQKRYLIDIGDDFSVVYGDKYSDMWSKVHTLKESRIVLKNIETELQKLPNSERCGHIGKPSNCLFYIGTKCDPLDAKIDFNRLMKQYPNHECQENCDSKGFSEFQRMILN